MKRQINVTMTLAALFFLAGCASGLSGETYSRGEAGTAQRVEYGTVISLRPVRIEGTKSNIGAGAGAVAGGIAGSTVGGGKGSSVAAVIGAVAGGLLGAATEEGMTRTDGVDIGLKMEDGREISVVQELSQNEVFRVGDKVRVLFTGRKVRVAH
ncbi:MAG: glycine zipper 2TM domain-containing protein [Gammaproteobacteria bacterium]|jgi:outer membrane lipoprotein SlyB